MKKRLTKLLLLLLTISSAQISLANFAITPNAGQWPSDVLFSSNLKGCKLIVRNAELYYYYYDAELLSKIQHNESRDSLIDAHGVKVTFLGANPLAEYLGKNPYDYVNNYFLGNDPKTWKSGVKTYQKLYIRNIYKGIDFEMYQSESGLLKYNFILSPTADPNLIQLKYEGADSIYLENGMLKLKTIFGTQTEMRPLVFEENSPQNPISSYYQLNGNTLTYHIARKRNAESKLIIDPELVFSTYSGSLADNFGYTATYDTLGHAYSGGTVFGIGFPSTGGAFQIAFAGGAVNNLAIGYVSRDCGILKFSPDGKTLVYCTYIGGIKNNEQPHSMIVDSKMNLLIMGTTRSDDFPIGIAPAFDWSHNGGSDIFVIKLSSDGSDILAGTFVGGTSNDGLNSDRAFGSTTPLLYNYADDFRGEIIVDTNDNVFVSSSTYSSNFPMRNEFDNSFGGIQDACFFGLNPDLSDLLFSSYFGGTGADAAYGLDLGTHNDIYFTGGTNSGGLPYLVPGMTQSYQGGRADGFLARMDLTTFGLMSYTFIGTPQYDQSYFVKTDKYGKPFVYGQSEGFHNISTGVYGVNNSRMFLKKFELNCTNVELQTTFGANGKPAPDISPTAFLIDECERIFVAGWGGTDFSGFSGGGTRGMPYTEDAYQKTTDEYDFYLAVFSKGFDELQYGTFFGGKSSFTTESHEHVDGGTSRFDKKGVVYQAVCAGCGRNSLFPATPGVWSTTNKSRNCNNAIFKFDFENLNRQPQVKDTLFVLTATDTLDFSVDVFDPDRQDSLRIVLEGGIFDDPTFPDPPVLVSKDKLPGSNTIRLNFKFISTCEHIAKDTFEFRIKVYDQGCPSSDSNTSVVKIVVNDPPLSVTPGTYCLNIDEQGRVKIQWDAFEKNRFFDYVLLQRVNPNGKAVILDTIFNNQSGEYRDFPPGDPTMDNFTYLMLGYNQCGVMFDNGIRVSTTREFNEPIDSTYLTYATVLDNQFVSVHWFPSTEEDFQNYDIFRADNVNGETIGYRKIASIFDRNDTNFIDEKVEVDEKSYCYRIGINDQCGHVSVPSNEACNIVLKGDVGHLYFDLDWLPYRTWHGGVEHYELSRRVDTGELRFIANTGLLRTHHDEDLDLWWGAYYYRVEAFEGLNSNGEGFAAKSLSNSIRLIQPPMVFVPNAYTPNGDPFNEIWGFTHAFVKEFRMQVFNRWGEKVWDSQFKGDQWDGKTKGKDANNDVFIWIVTYRGWDGQFHTQKGTVTVLP